MKKLGNFRIKYLKFCAKIMSSKYAHKIPRFIQFYLIGNYSKMIKFSHNSNRYTCPYCNAFIKYKNDCKACGAVNTHSWWYRR